MHNCPMFKKKKQIKSYFALLHTCVSLKCTDIEIGNFINFNFLFMYKQCSNIHMRFYSYHFLRSFAFFMISSFALVFFIFVYFSLVSFTCQLLYM